MRVIKRVFMALSFMAIPFIVHGRFSNPDLQNYYLAGQFGFQTPFDASMGKNANYYYTIHSISNVDLPANTPMILANLLGKSLGNNFDQLKITNGITIILRPDIVAGNKTREQKQDVYNTLPLVIVEGVNDLINIYLYNTSKIGTKLVFDILAFEDFMMKTSWMQAQSGSHKGWYIGFEFVTESTDFTGSGLTGEKPTLFANQQGIHPFFIDLVIDQPPKTPYFPTQYSAQYLAAMGSVGLDRRKRNPNIFFQNNITYIRDLTDNDIDYVEKILLDAGVH